MNQRLIYDVGMHTGADCDFYLKKGFNVVGIEANPALVAHCEKRFASEIESGRLQIVNRAVSEAQGTIEFYIDDDNLLWGTAEPEARQRFQEMGHALRVIEVQATTMKEIFASFGVPYYMKIDIEGYDHLCLLGLEGISGRPRHISVEASATSFEATQAQLELLKSFGYTKFKRVLQNNVHKQKCPTPAREGKYVQYEFGASCSGLFGEELPGRWLSFDEAVRAYRIFYWKVGMIGPHTGVFRAVKSRLAGRILGRLFYPGGGWYDTHATY
ncbi:FkbM family methyltransferase [Methylocystis heyeri]|uniref:FkbM family methyltransferase n=1 Tax=Methylocystis heyeri TaxID=391905 RepID=A0A6B8KED3_9HYPH|nr:FkbM family methyltransferase [Methylocystis heyeri]QGM44928.1 FkbM family methyltransferase [Methylocystis heyeri]